MISLVPASICVTVYVLIFKYVRSSTRRIQPHSQNAQTGGTNMARPKLSRRDIHLLRHMIFIVGLFVIGWGFVNNVGVVNAYRQYDANLTTIAALFSQLSSLSIIIDLFLYNREIHQYLWDRLKARFIL